jgi:hypothetical protein
MSLQRNFYRVSAQSRKKDDAPALGEGGGRARAPVRESGCGAKTKTQVVQLER